jgi:hypothetical protein
MSPTPGELKDQGLRALLKTLAQRNKGLCLVTTRYRIKDIEGYAATVPQCDLAPLSKEAGAKLLKTLDVKGTQSATRKTIRGRQGPRADAQYHRRLGGASAPWPLEACRIVSERAALRAALYQAMLRGEAPASDHLRTAVDLMRGAGTQHHLPRALLTRALLRAATGAFDGAHEDLDEAYEIAERGPIRLHLADIHLHRARLFGFIPSRPEKYPWVSPRDDLDKAQRLIDECGYGRRRQELADAEAAWRRIYAGAASRGAD